MKSNFTNSILESVYGYYADTKNYINESLNEEAYSIVVSGDMLKDIMDQVQSGVFEQDGDYYKIPTTGNSTFCISPNGDAMIEDMTGDIHSVDIDNRAKEQILNMVHPTEYVDELSESTDETDMYDTQANAKPDTANFAAQGMGQIHENKQKNTNRKMKKTTRNISEARIRKILDIMMNESIDLDGNGLDPETFEDDYDMEQDYFRSPDADGMDVDSTETPDSTGDEEFYDDFLANPAEESFETTDDDFETNPEEEDVDQLLSDKEEGDMQQRQEDLLNYVTENWNHHANKLIL